MILWMEIDSIERNQKGRVQQYSTGLSSKVSLRKQHLNKDLMKAREKGLELSREVFQEGRKARVRS